MSRIRHLCIPLSIVASGACALAQGFNVDVNAIAGTPPATYSAAAGQSGVWNAVPATLPLGPLTLNGLSGAPSGVTLRFAAGPNGYNGLGAYNWNNPNTSGGDQNLMDDVLDVGGGFGGGIQSGVLVTLSGLAAGNYDVYTYCFAPDNYLPGNGGFPWNTLVSVSGSSSAQQTVGALDWGGAFVLGETYAKHSVVLAAGADLTILLENDISNLGFGSLNGLQIVPTVPAPQSYCTAGTSSNGCVPAISASANPSVSFATPCALSVANVEGQKSGLFFYGVDNSGFSPLPWALNGSSFLCVKTPTQRTSSQNSGGLAAQCNGAFALDWNAFQAANPSGLGQPWGAGSKAYVQAWYRDPPAPKTTNLSNALELTYLP